MASLQQPIDPAAASAAAGPAEQPPVLDAERLVVYRLAVELQVLASGLAPAQNRVIGDQLERASLSVVLNIAEGAGRYSRKEKRRFYGIARGSAMETAAAIDVLRARKLAAEASCASARAMALRCVQMLTKLDAALI